MKALLRIIHRLRATFRPNIQRQEPSQQNATSKSSKQPEIIKEDSNKQTLEQINHWKELRKR